MDEYISLLIVTLLAFITPLLFSKTRVPVVVGEILVGLGVGLLSFIGYEITGIKIVESGVTVEVLAGIGFIFLMFLSGLEIDFGKLERGGRMTLIKALIMLLMTMVLTYGLISLVDSLIGFDIDPFYMALILSTTSVAVVLSIVREMRISRTAPGQLIMVSALVADIVTMIVIAAYTINIQVTESNDFFYGVEAMIIVALIVLFFYLTFKLGSMAMWRYPEVMQKFFKLDDPHELGVRGSLAIIFIFVALSTVIESEALAVLGAFLAGAVISLLFQEGAMLGKKLFGVGYGFLVPIFFINIGISFDFEAILSPTVLIIPVLFLIAVVAKMFPAMLLIRSGDFKQDVAVGALLTGGLTLMIAAAQIGVSLEIITDTERGMIILLAVIFSAVMPIIFKQLYKIEVK
ncbi:MAG: cation:proton antiporter [Methanomassiliicoccales archaeon]|nr:cation:proton antiporter [Methanomassiliicoccales archaeon]